MPSRPKRKGYSTSYVCAYIPGEPAYDRHARRLALSWAGEIPVQSWCDHRGVKFRLIERGNNHPHAPLWVFKIDLNKGAAVARWSPGKGAFERITFITGKRVMTGRKREKVYDWRELLTLLESWFVDVQTLTTPPRRPA